MMATRPPRAGSRRCRPRSTPQRWRVLLLAVLAGLSACRPGSAEELPEYRLKAAFLYNFALFTEWPVGVGPVLNLCVLGKDPFGADLDPLQGKHVGERSFAVHRLQGLDGVRDCQVIFFSAAALGSAWQVLEQTRGAPVLTVADSPGALDLGVALNLSVERDKITFDANLAGPRGGGLKLSSKLLRLAHEVRQ